MNSSKCVKEYPPVNQTCPLDELAAQDEIRTDMSNSQFPIILHQRFQNLINLYTPKC